MKQIASLVCPFSYMDNFYGKEKMEPWILQKIDQIKFDVYKKLWRVNSNNEGTRMIMIFDAVKRND